MKKAKGESRVMRECGPFLWLYSCTIVRKRKDYGLFFAASTQVNPQPMKKRNLLSVILILTTGMVYGQIGLTVKGWHEKSNAELTFLYVARDVSSNGSMIVARDEATGTNFEVSWGYLKSVEFRPEDNDQFWQSECLKSKLYDNLIRSGFQYDRRKAMEDEMADYLSKAENNGLFYVDSYLESRLYALLRRVYPVRPTDGRPGVMSLRIVSDIIPDAWVGPDGTMITDNCSASQSSARRMSYWR
ncbi:MAG: hypothetical protein MZU84_05110 [Sphingobacterium sp.]|nr:hypothetical protein [Sphingobacterium sp.]